MWVRVLTVGVLRACPKNGLKWPVVNIIMGERSIAPPLPGYPSQSNLNNREMAGSFGRYRHWLVVWIIGQVYDRFFPSFFLNSFFSYFVNLESHHGSIYW